MIGDFVRRETGGGSKLLREKMSVCAAHVSLGPQ